MSSSTAGIPVRRLAIRALTRITTKGAYANLVLPPLLERSDLDERDKRLVTELVYGTTRMRRACDFLVDRFVVGEVEPEIRAALQVGAYQLHFLSTPPHAAVSATVGATRGRGRRLVNAVLRRVADAGPPTSWPDRATELSYPDWIVDAFDRRFGREAADQALAAMNEAASVHVRDDGYVQDPASQIVVERLGAVQGERVVDLCAAPGGKATALAAAGATVTALDVRPHRSRLIARNARSTGTSVAVATADGRTPPLRASSFDRVLIDAPCSGLGSLRRRPDARWRIDAPSVARLAQLQAELVGAGADLVAPGGLVLYSVCTITAEEVEGVRDAVLLDRPDLEAIDGTPEILVPGEWDGMGIVRFRRTAA